MRSTGKRARRRASAKPAPVQRDQRDTDIAPRLVRWTAKKAVGLAGIVVVALVTAIVGVVVTRADEHSKAAGDAAKPAVIIHADYDWNGTDGIQWVLPTVPSAADVRRISAPIEFGNERSIQQLETFLASKHGVKMANDDKREQQFTRVKLSIQSIREHTVAISDVRIHKLNCERPLAGTFIYGPPQGENELPTLAYDLDSTDTTARIIGDDGQLKEPYFDRKFITVSQAEPMVLVVQAFTGKRHCGWELLVTATVDGTESVFTVHRPDGTLFESTAWTTSYGMAFDLDFVAARFKPLGQGQLPSGIRNQLERQTT